MDLQVNISFEQQEESFNSIQNIADEIVENNNVDVVQVFFLFRLTSTAAKDLQTNALQLRKFLWTTYRNTGFLCSIASAGLNISLENHFVL